MTQKSLNQAEQSRLIPFITMVILLSLIGFITCINQQFQTPIKEAFLSEVGMWKNTFAILITFSFFLAYLLIGPIAAKHIDKHGYKKAITTGLLILSAGVLLFEVSALQYTYLPIDPIAFSSTLKLPISYFIFILGSFMCGTGLTFMQSSVNPYIVACHVNGTTGVQRQNIGGTGNSLMTTIGPLFVGSVIFGGVETNEITINAIFIPIAIVIISILILAGITNRLNLPEIESISNNNTSKPLRKSIWSFRHLRLGVVALFMYVGVEVCIGANINLYLQSDLGYNIEQASLYATWYWSMMLVGRFISSFLNKVSAKNLLIFSTTFASVLIGLTMLTATGAMHLNPHHAPYFLIAIGLCHAVMWGAIFTLAIKDLGAYTTKGSGVLMMGVVGGAILPLIQGWMADQIGAWNYTWAIVLVGELYMLYYALFGSKVQTINNNKQ